jgi:hypothetical protein
VTFKAGESGNPQGMRRGTKHRFTRQMNKLATKEGPAILKSIVEKAKTEPFYASLFIRYIAPKAKVNPEPIELPVPTTAAEAASLIADLTAKIAEGSLDIEVGTALVEGLQAFISARNVSQLEQEVEALRETVVRLTMMVEGGQR